MAIEVTDEAVAVLKRSLALTEIDLETGGVRLRGQRSLIGGFDVNVEFAEAPSDGEEIMETGGIRIFVDPSVTEAFADGIVTVEEPHDHVVVRQR